MSITKPVIYNLSIVLVGNFNPSIVNPSWLAYKKLIRESEVENATIKIIHPDLANFSLSFVNIQCSPEKFVINCENEADFDLVKDLATSIFSILNETPVSGIGINHYLDFELNTDKEFYDFGNWLAPNEIWNETLNDPKLFELKITEPFFDSGPVKNMTTVRTSEKIKTNGIRFELNYHIELKRVKNNRSIPDIIINHWKSSFDKSKEVFDSLIKRFYE